MTVCYLSAERIEGIASDIRNVAKIAQSTEPSPYEE